jgi:hypothetical protein
MLRHLLAYGIQGLKPLAFPLTRKLGHPATVYCVRKVGNISAMRWNGTSTM